MFGFGKKKKPRVAIIPLNGPITDGGGGGLFLDRVAPQIDAAFGSKPDLVLLKINCPGGSPVQSHLISQYIVHRSNESQIPVAAFCEDVAASGGYWLAMTASPHVFVHPMSIIGSVGVVGAGFGFHELISALGVERRVYTVGKNKVTNDPFQPETDDGREKIGRIQKSIYDIFVSNVKHMRSIPEDMVPEDAIVQDDTSADQHEDGFVTLLQADDDTLFNGDVWVGKEAVDLGLADALYVDLKTTVEDFFFEGQHADYRYYVERTSFLKKLPLPFIRAGVAHLHAKIEELVLKSRVGI